MSMFYAFVIICFFGFYGESWTKYVAPEWSHGCPHAKTLSSLNQAKFSGLWYPSRRSPKRYESIRCLKVMINFRENNNMSFAPSGTFLGMHFDGEVFLRSPISEPAKFKVKNTGIKFWILDTDYDSFFVAYSCSRKNRTRSITTEIYTRERKAAQSVIDRAFEVVERRTWIRRKSFSKFDQNGCPVK